uniref:Uncharacterized protein n=1 Tax=Anguilla anguilla TaxID=7936 RepID=A0A0E9WYT4_ANGAN
MGMEKREKKMKCPGTVRNLYPIIPLSCLRSDIGECVVKVCGEHLKIKKSKVKEQISPLTPRCHRPFQRLLQKLQIHKKQKWRDI